MEPFISDARSLITLVSFISFLGIVWWAYGARRKTGFEEAAMLPLTEEDDLEQATAQAAQERVHG
jgi:cytochrome c oxidase cbb3-type subunit IV